MPFTLVPDVAVGASFTEAMWDTYIKGNLNDGLARPVGHTQLGSAAATVTFSSLPGTMGGLLGIWSARSDLVALTTTVMLRFNGDSGTTYDYQRAYAQASLNATEGLTQTSANIGHLPGTTGVANAWSSGFVFVPSYASGSVHKTTYALNAQKWGTTTAMLQVNAYQAIWESTAAITSFQFLCGGGANFLTGSRFTLFGLGLV
jgi:hypothetical protein